MRGFRERGWDMPTESTFYLYCLYRSQELNYNIYYITAKQKHYKCALPTFSSSPELCHLGFGKGGFGWGYILIWYFRGSHCRCSCRRRLMRDLLLPIYQGHLWWYAATHIKVSEWISFADCVKACILVSCTHLAAGGAGLLGVVGDGCSCFSMVSFTNSWS